MVIQFDTLDYLNDLASIIKAYGVNPNEVIQAILYQGQPYQVQL